MSLPVEVCRWIVRNTNFLDAVQARGRDAPWRVFIELVRILQIAGSECGTPALSDTAIGEESEASYGRGVLGIRAAAARIGISERAVRKAIEKEKLQAHKVAGLCVVTENAVHEFVRERRRRGATT